MRLPVDNADRSFWSRDGRFGFTISRRETERLVELCQHADSRETGGILVGFYDASFRCATLCQVSGPPADSRSGYTWFWRGKKGLAKWLRRLWHSDHHF